MMTNKQTIFERGGDPNRFIEHQFSILLPVLTLHDRLVVIYNKPIIAMPCHLFNTEITIGQNFLSIRKQFYEYRTDVIAPTNDCARKQETRNFRAKRLQFEIEFVSFALYL